MTSDEIADRIKFVTMDEEDGVPGARFAREMAEEVLQLRAELARLKPLAEAAMRLGQTPEPGVAHGLDDITGRVKAERDVLWIARGYAAQFNVAAQDGAA